MYGVQHLRNGSIASNALKTDEGIERGRDERNGDSTEGVDW